MRYTIRAIRSKQSKLRGTFDSYSVNVVGTREVGFTIVNSSSSMVRAHSI